MLPKVNTPHFKDSTKLESIIVFEKVSKIFQKKLILDEVSLSIHRGDLVGLIGPSGAGKTTLFKLFLEISKPDSGTIFFREEDLHRRTGFASQDYSFYPLLSLRENIEYFGTMVGLSSKEIKSKTASLLSLVGLSHARDTPAGNLSGGMKRRFDVALALLGDPEFLIVDEPTTGLDVVTKKQIWELLADINRQGKTILVSSHDLDEVEQYCSSILFLNNKKIIPNAELQKVLHSLSKPTLENLFRVITHA